MDARPHRLAWVATALTVGFAALAVGVAVAGGVPGDRRVVRGLRSAVGGRFDDAARLVDALTDSWWLVLSAAVLAMLLLRAGRPRAAVLLGLSVAGAVAGNPLWKRLVDRPRPDVLSPLADVSPLSFPSGHAAGTAAVAVAAILAAAGTRWFAAATVGALALLTGAAAAQLLLARHYPSDILGGWLWATAWTCAVWAVGTSPRRRRQHG